MIITGKIIDLQANEIYEGRLDIKGDHIAGITRYPADSHAQLPLL